MLILLFIKGPDEGRVIALADHQAHTLGCGDVTLRLADKSVSSRHAELWHDQDGWCIRDIGSAHGTYINAKRITEPTNLAEGDRIHVGKTILVLARIPQDLITNRSFDSSQQWIKVVQGFFDPQQPQLDSLTHQIAENISILSKTEHRKMMATPKKENDNSSDPRDIGHTENNLLDASPLDHELDQQMTSSLRSNDRDTETKLNNQQKSIKGNHISSDEDVEHLKEATCSILMQLRPLLDQVLHRLDHAQFPNEHWINGINKAAEIPSLQTRQLLEEMVDSMRKSIAPDLAAIRNALDDLSRRLDSGPAVEQWAQVMADMVQHHLDSFDSSIRERQAKIKSSDILARQQQERPESQVSDSAQPDTPLMPIAQTMPTSDQITSKPILHTNRLVKIARKMVPTVVLVAASVVIILGVLNFFFWQSFTTDDTLVGRDHFETSIDDRGETRSKLVDLAVGGNPVSATDVGAQQSISSGLSPSAFGSFLSADSMTQSDLDPDQSSDSVRLTRLKKDYQRAMETGKPVIVGAGQINSATGELSQGRLLDPHAARKAGITNWQDWYQLDDLKERHRLQRLVEIYTGGQGAKSDSVTRNSSLDR